MRRLNFIMLIGALVLVTHFTATHSFALPRNDGKSVETDSHENPEMFSTTEDLSNKSNEQIKMATTTGRVFDIDSREVKTPEIRKAEDVLDDLSREVIVEPANQQVIRPQLASQPVIAISRPADDDKEDISIEVKGRLPVVPTPIAGHIPNKPIRVNKIVFDKDDVSVEVRDSRIPAVTVAPVKQAVQKSATENVRKPTPIRLSDARDDVSLEVDIITKPIPADIRIDDSKIKQRAMKQILQARTSAGRNIKPKTITKTTVHSVEDSSTELRDRVAAVKLASSMQVVRNRTSPAIQLQTLTRGKSVPRHSVEIDNISLEVKDRLKPVFRPRVERPISRQLGVPRHSVEDVSLEVLVPIVPSVPSVSVTSQPAATPGVMTAPAQQVAQATPNQGNPIFRHSDERDDVSLEIRDRIRIPLRSAQQNDRPAPRITKIVPTAPAMLEAQFGGEDVSLEVVIQQDGLNQTATLVAVQSNERVDDDLSLEIRDRVVVPPGRPVVEPQLFNSREDVSLELVVQQDGPNQTASVVAVHSNERPDGPDDDFSLEINERFVVSVTTDTPMTQTESGHVRLSLHSDEDDGFSFEMIDGVLHKIISNDTIAPIVHLAHHSGEQDDNSSELRAQIQAQLTGAKANVPPSTRSGFLDGALHSLVENRPASSHHSDEQDFSLELIDGVLHQVIRSSTPTPIGNHPLHSDEQDDDLSWELIDGVLRQIVRNRTAVQGQRLLGHSDELDDDNISLELRNLNSQNPALSVISDSGERENLSAEDHIITQDAQNRTVILERHSNERQDVSIEVFVQDPSPDAPDRRQIFRHSDERHDFSLEDRDRLLATLEITTTIPGQGLLRHSDERDDFSLENRDVVVNPLDGSLMQIVPIDQNRKLLKEFAEDVVDDLFSAERSDDIRNSIRLNQKTSDSFRTADSHSASDSAFFEHQTAGASAVSFFLPLLIACLLFSLS